MTDRECLLEAIRLNLADDAPRLIYADWLDEHGEADAAEFIRLQLRLATGVPPTDRPEWELRAVELARTLAVQPLYAGVCSRVLLTARRGLIESHTIVPPTEDAAPPSRFTPLSLRHVTICRLSSGKQCERLAAAGILAGAKSVRIRPRRDGCFSPALPTLIESAALNGVRELDLSGGMFGWPGFGELCPVPLRLPGVERLNLRGCRLSSSHVDWICLFGEYLRLRELDLSRNRLRDGAVEALLKCDWAARLRRLDLREPDAISQRARRKLRSRFGAVVEGI